MSLFNPFQNLSFIETIPEGWKIKTFKDVFKDSSSGNIKILKSEVLNSGSLAVVDQGKSLIIGYTNNYDAKCNVGEEALVFGDHTRSIKYINFPFAMGADGTKILQLKDNNSYKYLYYFLDSVELPSDGYSRHFKHLKNVIIPLPPIETQRSIVEILDKAQTLIDKRKEQIKEMDSLVQSLFYDMFGDPVTNPMGWEVKKLGNLISFLTSGSRGWAKYHSDNGLYFLKIQNVKNSKLILQEVQYVNPPETKETKRTRVQEGDLLISITADLGRTAVVSKEVELHGAHINQHLALLRLSREILLPIYTSFFLESDGGRRQFISLDQNGVKSGLNFDAIKSVKINIPPIDLQKTFADKVKHIEQQKEYMTSSLKELEDNFNCLMQKAFKGELV